MIQNTKTKTVARDTASNFLITVAVGGGQPSSTTVYRNGAVAGSGKDNFSISVADIVPGDHVQVVTTVSDLPGTPNRITVEHTVQPSSVKTNFDDNVTDGEIAIDTSSFYFY
jgi:hypothetical protein